MFETVHLVDKIRKKNNLKYNNKNNFVRTHTHTHTHIIYTLIYIYIIIDQMAVMTENSEKR